MDLNELLYVNSDLHLMVLIEFKFCSLGRSNLFNQ